MDYSQPGFSVHGILQARRLEWVAILFFRASSPPRDWTWVSCMAGRFFTVWASRNIPLARFGGSFESRERQEEEEKRATNDHGNPLQYSCLENSMDRWAWWAIYSPWGHRESDVTEWLSHTHTMIKPCVKVVLFFWHSTWLGKGHKCTYTWAF